MVPVLSPIGISLATHMAAEAKPLPPVLSSTLQPSSLPPAAAHSSVTVAESLVLANWLRHFSTAAWYDLASAAALPAMAKAPRTPARIAMLDFILLIPQNPVLGMTDHVL